jgi:hypothetical protein
MTIFMLEHFIVISNPDHKPRHEEFHQTRTCRVVRGKGRSERTQELLSLKQQLLVQMIHLVHSLMHYFPSVDHPADYSAEPEIYLPLKNVF